MKLMVCELQGHQILDLTEEGMEVYKESKKHAIPRDFIRGYCSPIKAKQIIFAMAVVRTVKDYKLDMGKIRRATCWIEDGRETIEIEIERKIS